MLNRAGQEWPEGFAQEIESGLAFNFDVPAQRIINAAFAKAGLDRFDSEGNDLWEMYVCEKNGWEYEKPPEHLASRWASY